MEGCEFAGILDHDGGFGEHFAVGKKGKSKVSQSSKYQNNIIGNTINLAIWNVLFEVLTEQEHIDEIFDIIDGKACNENSHNRIMIRINYDLCFLEQSALHTLTLGSACADDFPSG